MGYPTEQRFKILQQQYQDAQQIAVPAPTMKPQVKPGVVIDYIARTDIGYCLKVIPFEPKVITTAGELTFDDGSSNVPGDASSRFYLKVYPADTAPADVQSAYSVGQVIFYFPFWGSGSNADIVRGSFICFNGVTFPEGEVQFQSYQMGSNNQTVWDFQRAHSMLS